MANTESWGENYNCGNVAEWCDDEKWKADVWNCCPCTCDPELCDLSYIYNPFNFDQFPLASNMGFYKSVMFSQNVVENLDNLKYALTKTPTPGYCERLVDEMVEVNNQKLCEGGTNYNVGYYYSMVLPVFYSEAKYTFKSPMYFDYGAVVMIDGDVVLSSSETTDTLDYTKKLKQGNHLL